MVMGFVDGERVISRLPAGHPGGDHYCSSSHSGGVFWFQQLTPITRRGVTSDED